MSNKTKYKEMERIIIDKTSIDEMEEDIIIRRGLERYMYVRQFVYGNVLDIASGVGYGSYLLSKNPDVVSVRGFDRAEKAVNHGNEHFASDKVQFCLGDPTTIEGKFDFLVCLETIEHLPDPTILNDMVERCEVKEMVISFPNKKTTHYNKYHLWDITEQNVRNLFKNYQCFKVKEMDDSTVMNFVRIERQQAERVLL